MISLWAKYGCANQLKHLGPTSYKDQATKVEEVGTQRAKRSPTVSPSTKTPMEHFTRSLEKGDFANHKQRKKYENTRHTILSR